MQKIASGNDIAKAHGEKSYREWLMKSSRRLAERGLLKCRWDGGCDANAAPVAARVDFGRWIADCECGGAEYVEPTDRVFFCQSCGTHGRPVIFPDDIAGIEAELLQRQVLYRVQSGNAAADEFMARPVVSGLSRSWAPGETVKDLKRQKTLAEAMAKAERG